MVEMVCQGETVWMEREDYKENRDHLDLKDSKDLGVLESLTSGGERPPALTLLELNCSMLGELVEVSTAPKEEEQRSFVCLLILTILMFQDQPVHHTSLHCTEQNMKQSTLAHYITEIFMSTTFPVLSAMPPPELQ